MRVSFEEMRTLRAKLWLTVLIASWLALAAHSSITNAAVGHAVPGDFATITAALGAAVPGDTILVAPGVYSASSNGETFPLNLSTDSLYLIGAGTDLSIIDAESTSTALICDGAVGSRISGFTITGGWADRGGGVWLKQETSMEVDHNLFLANGARLLGAGMMVDADAWVHHNVFWESFDTDTTDEQDPHGVRFQRDAAGVFEHNLVGRTDGNGLIVSSTAAPSVRHNIFYQNGAPAPGRRGRGICWFSTAPLVVYHNVFFDNEVAALLVPDLGGDYSGEEANDLFSDDGIYGNLDADPLLVDPDNGDLHLAWGSPAIDAGDPGLPGDPDSTVADIGPFYFDQSGGGIPRRETGARPVLVALSGPFYPGIKLRFALAEPALISLAVYDIHGRRLAMLADGGYGAGEFTVTWDRTDFGGRKVGSGVYFAGLRAGDSLVIVKLIVVN